MRKKFRTLSAAEESSRANKTLLRGTCFVTKVPLSDKPYELVWHAGAKSYVFINKNLITKQHKETTDESRIKQSKEGSKES